MRSAGRGSDNEVGFDSVFSALMRVSAQNSEKSIKSNSVHLRPRETDSSQRRLRELAEFYVVEAHN